MQPASPLQDPKPTVLVVDDTPENLAVTGALLQPQYRVKVAGSGARALKVAAAPPAPDLILLDLVMPDMDGYEVLERLRRDPATREVPVIFLTAQNAEEEEWKGLELGAVDYITKPIRPAILLSRVRTHLELKQARDWLRDQNGFLEREVSRRMRENELVKDASLHALATLAEIRDPETGHHLQRTQAYVDTLARRIAGLPGLGRGLTEARILRITKASPLHDLGKVGIPDHILLKPGRLTPEEFEVMKTHTVLGAHAIEEAIRRVAAQPTGDAGAPSDLGPLAFLEDARLIAHCHHEKWDGSGYPRGLKGEDIPLPARLMALADVYDALSCRRVYKAPLPAEEVVSLIVEGRGGHFDPALVDAFLELVPAFRAIAERFSDPQA